MTPSRRFNRDRVTSRRALLGTLGSAGLVGLAGCGGGTGATGSTSTGSNTTAPPSSTPATTTATGSEMASRTSESGPTENAGTPNVFSGTLTLERRGLFEARDSVTLDVPSGRVVEQFGGVEPDQLPSGETAFVTGCGEYGSQLVIADSDGVVSTQVTGCNESTLSDLPYYAPQLSPDGRTVAVVLDSLLDETGDTTTVVYDRKNHELARYEGYTTSTWTPDGRLLLTGIGTGQVPFGLYLANKSFSKLERVDGGAIKSSVGYPDVHPDGKRVAFTYNNEIWEIGIGGGGDGLRKLIRSQDLLGFPTWSPDGNAIALTITHNDVTNQLIYFGEVPEGKRFYMDVPFYPGGRLSWNR